MFNDTLLLSKQVKKGNKTKTSLVFSLRFMQLLNEADIC